MHVEEAKFDVKFRFQVFGDRNWSVRVVSPMQWSSPRFPPKVIALTTKPRISVKIVYCDMAKLR